MKRKSINLLLGVYLIFSVLLTANSQEAMDFPAENENESVNQMPKMNKRHHRLIFHMIKKDMPELAAKIENEKNNNPAVFRAFVTRMGSQDLKMARIGKDADIKSKKLMEDMINKELDSFRIGDKYKKTESEEEKEELQKELNTLLNEIFEMKELFQQNMIQHMEARIIKVKDFMNKRRDLKSSIIAERVKELTQDDSQESIMRW